MQRENHAKGKAVSGVSSMKNHNLTNDINGSYGHDILVGSDCADIINGYAGNDKIYGKAGNDRLNGGDGYDYIEGGAGVDRIAGGAGDDTLDGGADSDVIRGEDGDDLVLGGAGDDASLSGGAGDDFVFGGQGNDLMAGGTGDDTLVGGQGADRMYGNQGYDSFIYKDLADSTAYKTDYIHDFQTNRDVLDFRALNLSADDINITHNGANYRVSTKNSDFTVDVQTTAGRTLTIDDIILTDGSHKNYGDMNDNRMTADHKQYVYGMAGADRLDASKGKGFNSLHGGEGDDLLRGAHHDHLYGGEGADRLVSKGKGFNYLSGGEGKDVIYSNAAHDEIEAGAGDDIIHAFNNHTEIEGGEGSDILHLSGKHSDYGFETKGDQVIVSRLNGDKPETHILSGVERLHFSDKTASDMQGNLISYEAPAGNTAIDWMKMTLEAIKNHPANPLVASRGMAIESVAVLDTLRGIAGKEGFTANIDAPDVISEDAGVAAAAHRVLTTLFPGQKALFDEAFTKSLDGIADGMAEDNGVAYGQAVADAVLADRANDGSAQPKTWHTGTNAGEWRPTPAGYANALNPHWGSVKPFILDSGDQFRPAPPPAVGSDEYVKQYNEVKELGAANSTTRTQDQAEIALFWADGGGTYTPPGHWAEIAADILKQDHASLSDSAEIFATLNTALADSAIAAWDAKYHYNYWRPVTAIHEGENDGNDMTQGDPNWKPFINTPPFPEYVSGHSTFSAAGATVLTDLLGDLAFASMSVTYTREFESFFEAAEEAGISRIYGGIHFQEGNTSGRALGQAIGEQALQKFA